MRCEEVFFGTYRKPPLNVAFCPYRVCPMGAHSDHQYGKVTGFAIDKGVHIAYAPKQNGVIELAAAFVLSPYGLPMLGAWLGAQLHLLRDWMKEKVYW